MPPYQILSFFVAFVWQSINPSMKLFLSLSHSSVNVGRMYIWFGRETSSSHRSRSSSFLFLCDEGAVLSFSFAAATILLLYCCCVAVAVVSFAALCIAAAAAAARSYHHYSVNIVPPFALLSFHHGTVRRQCRRKPQWKSDGFVCADAAVLLNVVLSALSLSLSLSLSFSESVLSLSLSWIWFCYCAGDGMEMLDGDYICVCCRRACSSVSVYSCRRTLLALFACIVSFSRGQLRLLALVGGVFSHTYYILQVHKLGPMLRFDWMPLPSLRSST